MGQGGGGGVPRQHPSSGHLAVADTWAPPRAAWLSPCPCWLSRGRTPAPGPPTVPSAPWRPALCRRPRTRATSIRWSHVPTSDAAMGTSSNATCCPATAQAPCVAAATPPSQTVLITCLGDRADSAPKRRGQATAADKLGAAVAPHRPCLACSTTEEDEVDTGDKVATGTRWPWGQGGHGGPQEVSQLFLQLSPTWGPKWPGPCTSWQSRPLSPVPKPCPVGGDIRSHETLTAATMLGAPEGKVQEPPTAGLVETAS